MSVDLEGNRPQNPMPMDLARNRPQNPVQVYSKELQERPLEVSILEHPLIHAKASDGRIHVIQHRNHKYSKLVIKKKTVPRQEIGE